MLRRSGGRPLHYKTRSLGFVTVVHGETSLRTEGRREMAMETERAGARTRRIPAGGGVRLAAVILCAFAVTAVAADKPRVFITESCAPQASADATAGDAKGELNFIGGTSPQSMEVMKAFVRQCPAVVVTSSRDKADYIVVLDHEEPNPTTLFVHGNKVAVFNRGNDLIYTTSTHLLGSAVKGACAAIAGSAPK